MSCVFADIRVILGRATQLHNEIDEIRLLLAVVHGDLHSEEELAKFPDAVGHQVLWHELTGGQDEALQTALLTTPPARLTMKTL